MPEPPPLPVLDGVVEGYDVDVLAHEYRINGFVILEDFVKQPTLERLRARFDWMCDNVRATPPGRAWCRVSTPSGGARCRLEPHPTAGRPAGR